ncbi:YraN family protein [Metallumcola ferriviriculae]|uniref:UPF0102 protein MFMK1_002059 n=1 Tax=Metallumcola ferriviriculae TaxID=3039180 RepID=A0AAU0UQV8_9FIRM|nr:YraN family protein [Desulfitibacteraceae bacterium MK1]
MPTKGRVDKGKRGEDAAVLHLKKFGYQIVARNFRCRYGEIDIIARDGDTLVFVEVKSRTSARFGSPFESVDIRKQKKLRQLAVIYLQSVEEYVGNVRFDVVGVYLTPAGEVTEINVIKHAF